ncbi:MAG TPA: hypothetical protein VKH62_11840 [Candidatus Binatia bacterium]|nr:hypothetical protein [Candidatus Binatia bacterium]
MKNTAAKTILLILVLIGSFHPQREITLAQVVTGNALYISPNGTGSNSANTNNFSKSQENRLVQNRAQQTIAPRESADNALDNSASASGNLPTSNGILRVHPNNPRYFTDDSGKAIYLGGHQVFVDLQDNTFDIDSTYNNQQRLDFSWYMEFLNARNLNYIRNWTAFSTGAGSNGSTVASPMPFKRVSGHGNANDGGLKFDLNQFDEAFFDRMRSRIIEAGNNGIIVSLMLFDVYGFSNFDDTLWQGNVFNGDNNINGIDTDPNNDNWGYEFFYNPSSQLLAIQQSYVRRIIDTVNDLDNVMYEIANELGNADWQYGMIDLIKNYESTKSKQHLTLLSPGGVSATSSYTDLPQNTIIDSPADVFAVSPHWADYINNPPTNDHGKPGIIDMDHVFWRDEAMGTNIQIPWKAFTRGYHFNLYDAPFERPENETAEWEMLRRAAGSTVTSANKVSDLASMLPSTSISSTGFALANPGAEYLVYAPAGGSFTVDLIAGTYSYEWFSPASASIMSTGSVTVSGANRSFTAPFSGDAVLYLKNRQ